jgi:TolB-like protein/opacity protein-like surface antigen
MRKLFTCFLFTLATIGVYAQSVDLNTGIKSGATYFEQNLQSGTSIAVLSIRSESLTLSEYIIDELSSYLVNGRTFTIVDRANIDLIRREMNYQLSGDVSDETAQSIGKRIGAQTVITGSVQQFGNEYRIDLRALSVETGVIQGVLRQDIAIDNRIRTLIGAPLVDSTASEREQKSAAPRAGGSRFFINAGGGGGIAFEPDLPLFLFSAGLDYLFPLGLSLGGYFAYLTYKEEYSSSTSHSSTIGTMFTLNAKIAWNFNLSQNIIPYIGLLLGYNIGKEDYEWSSISSSFSNNTSHSDSLDSLSFGADMGIRFFFTDHIGAFIEVVFNHDIFADYNFLMATLGLSLKF